MRKIVTFLLTVCMCLFMGIMFTACDDENKHEHTYGEWVEVDAPTCKEKGLREKNCECGEKLTEEIATISHSDEIITGIAATCTENGLTDGKKCSVCQTVIVEQQVIDAKGHTCGGWSQVKAPDCVTKGLERRDCDDCDYYETRDVEALGHDRVYHNAQAATCTAVGWNAYETCNRCSYTTYVEISAKGHNTVYIPAVEPTFEQNGLTEGSYCSICNTVFTEQNVVNKYVAVFVEYDKDALTVTAPEKASAGSSIKVSATVQSGYIFLGWYSDGQLLSSNAEYSFTLGEITLNLTAESAKGNKWDGTVASGFAGGNGTSSSPYLISTGAQLARLASLINDTSDNSYYKKYYKLTNDIDLAEINWTPIGTMLTSATGSADVTRAFQGNFDGCGFTIYNLNITNAKGANYGYIGLFGCAINATITDLNLVNVKITANNCTNTVNMGSVVGRADSTTIARCYVNCNLNYSKTNAHDLFVGGIVGRTYTGTITDCIIEGNVSAKNTNASWNVHLGGIVGYANAANVSNCISTTTCYSASGKTAIAGGLVGYMENSSTVKNCISLGTGETYSYQNYVTYPHKFCAYIKDSASKYSNCYSTVTYSESFFVSTLGWNATLWDFSNIENENLPSLIQSN